MTLGERCDEILRLIDETLADLMADPGVGATSPAAVTVLPRAAAIAEHPSAGLRAAGTI